MPGAGSSPTTARTAFAQSPVSAYASSSGPSWENRAQRKNSFRSSPQSQPRSACSAR